MNNYQVGHIVNVNKCFGKLYKIATDMGCVNIIKGDKRVMR